MVWFDITDAAKKSPMPGDFYLRLIIVIAG